MTRRTTSPVRKIAENLAMGGLIALSRGLSTTLKVQDVVTLSERAGTALRWTSPLRQNDDTLIRSRHLAYRWSRFVPGANCLHRATATRVWLAAYRMESRVVLGFRKRNGLEGHAWLEVSLPEAVTLMFVSDDDGYEVALVR